MIKKPFLPSAHRSSLEACWKEGVAAIYMITITDYYFIPLGLLLGASPFQIGFLVAVPHLLGSFAQFLSVRIVRLIGSRRIFLVRGTALQGLLLLPLAFLPLYPVPGRVEIFILIVTFFRVMGNLIGTVWGSLASDYLAAEERGAYFGWRSQITGAAGMISLGLAGVLIYGLKRVSPEAAFAVLFASAVAARFISSWLMSRMQDINIAHKKESDFTFWQFIARFHESNFFKFVIYVAAVTFATQLAAPYFTVLMLEDLGFSYLAYITVHMTAMAAGFVSYALWGRHADVVGNAKVLRLTGALIPIIPLLWVFSPALWYLIAVEFFAGFAWAGFNLCSVNFIYDAVTPEKRVRCLGYFNLIIGVSVAAGASLGGYLAETLPPLNGSRIYTLCVLSAILRFLAYLILYKKFREVRSGHRRVSSADLLFSVVGLRPMLGRNREWNAALSTGSR